MNQSQVTGELLGNTGRIHGERFGDSGSGCSCCIWSTLSWLCPTDIRGLKSFGTDMQMRAGMNLLLPSRIPKEESTNRNYSISRGKVHRLTIVSNQWNTALISCIRPLLCINKDCLSKDSKFLHCNICSVLEKGKLCTDGSMKCRHWTSASFLLQKIVKHDIRTFLLSLWPYSDWISKNMYFLIFFIKFGVSG